jgi:RHS repeat-associated protein
MGGSPSSATAPAPSAGWVGTLGVERDDATGLIFMRNRYYDVEQGRFIQMDPIGINAGDVNWYRYCNNDVCRFVDPSGCQDTLCKTAKPKPTTMGKSSPVTNPMGKTINPMSKIASGSKSASGAGGRVLVKATGKTAIGKVIPGVGVVIDVITIGTAVYLVVDCIRLEAENARITRQLNEKRVSPPQRTTNPHPQRTTPETPTKIDPKAPGETTDWPDSGDDPVRYIPDDDDDWTKFGN